MNRRNFINGIMVAGAGFMILPGAGRIWVPETILLHHWSYPSVPTFDTWDTDGIRRVNVGRPGEKLYTGRTMKISKSALKSAYAQWHKDVTSGFKSVYAQWHMDVTVCDKNGGALKTRYGQPVCFPYAGRYPIAIDAFLRELI